jgi:membrane protein implicated in regulation of membrane protease activity
MGAFFESLNAVEKIFFICAVLGGVMFILRLLLSLFGGDHHDADMGGDVHGGFDVHDVQDVHHDSDASFKILSLQGLTAFFMMFGLVGLALSRQSGWATMWATIGAFTGGLAAMWIMAKIFKGMTKLQSDGTMDIQNAVGQEGTVYLTIPAEGEGKIQVTVQGSLRELTAVSKYKTEIKTGERIVVDSVTGANLLVVTKI